MPLSILIIVIIIVVTNMIIWLRMLSILMAMILDVFGEIWKTGQNVVVIN